MLATSLAAVLAVLAPIPQTADLNRQATSYVASGTYQPGILSQADSAVFRQGLAAARARDVAGARNAISTLGDGTARKLVEWALVDTSADQLSFAELAQEKATLAGWPRGETRIAAGERALDRANMGADATLAYFGSDRPTTVEGTIALADALDRKGRSDEARLLIQEWWQTQSFDATNQGRILSRWGSTLTQRDHEARLNMLLVGPHGPATRAMINLVSPERQTIANAVLALRGAYSPDAIVANLSPTQAMDPNVVLERVRILRAAGRETEGFPLLSALPPSPLNADAQTTLWSERRNYFLDALERREWRAAYDAMAGHRFPAGEKKVDAEFFAGWVALTRLNDPTTAARHFETLRQSSQTPITQGRALYWLGRAAEAQGDQAGAQVFYQGGARHIQTFYGQLAAEKAGISSLSLPADPHITQNDTARFEANEIVRAARILGETGEMGLFRVFAYQLDDALPGITDLAQLMDMARGYGDGFGAMMVGRAASQRGFLMPERQYPIRIPPVVAGAAPLEFTLAITRQESSFDPRARSAADARGMMQFLPSTASGVARRLGMPYSADRLWDPDYNMTLGSYHLGELMSQFSGSMLLTTVGYNAGPARPPQWTARCGDPRGGVAGGGVDPTDFIECAPFTETRNYMMRVMENMSVYKARLHGGSAPLTLSRDIAAGSNGPRPYQ